MSENPRCCDIRYRTTGASVVKLHPKCTTDRPDERKAAAEQCEADDITFAEQRSAPTTEY